jgi:hypothetical protein
MYANVQSCIDNTSELLDGKPAAENGYGTRGIKKCWDGGHIVLAKSRISLCGCSVKARHGGSCGVGLFQGRMENGPLVC